MRLVTARRRLAAQDSRGIGRDPAAQPPDAPGQGGDLPQDGLRGAGEVERRDLQLASVHGVVAGPASPAA